MARRPRLAAVPRCMPLGSSSATSSSASVDGCGRCRPCRHRSRSVTRSARRPACSGGHRASPTREVHAGRAEGVAPSVRPPRFDRRAPIGRSRSMAHRLTGRQMARPTVQRRTSAIDHGVESPHPRGPRSHLWTFVSLFVIALRVFLGAIHHWGTGQLTPKLGLDLEGGTQMVLEPVLADPKRARSARVSWRRPVTSSLSGWTPTVWPRPRSRRRAAATSSSRSLASRTPRPWTRSASPHSCASVRCSSPDPVSPRRSRPPP